LGAVGDVDGLLCSFGAPVRAESGVDGLPSAAHTSMAPIMASPTATEALTSRLGRRRDEPNISLDPLIDSAQDRPRTAYGRALDFAGAYRVSLRVCSRTCNALVQHNGKGDHG
jgi:hypothetical protein